MEQEEREHSSRDFAVEEAIDDLAADFERLGKPLELERIERLVAARQLRFAQVERILDALAAAGVPVLTETFDEPSRDPVDLPAGVSPSATVDEFQWRTILDHPLLDHKTESELGRAIAAGVSAKAEIEAGNATPRAMAAVARAGTARDKLATSNLRLVWTWAAKYAAMTGLDPTDLFQDGVIGLMRAVDRYDPDAGFRFSTYAVWWIRQAVQRSVADKGKTVRVPAYVHEQLMRLARATRLLWRENGARPTLAMLAEELACDREHVAFLQGLATLVPVSLDAPTLDGEGEPLVETLAADVPTPEALTEAAEVAAQVREALKALPKQMRDIVSRRHGIGGGRPETLERIGSSMGVTRERIRQIERKAMDVLKRTVPLRLGLPPPVEPLKIKTPKVDAAGNVLDEGSECE